MDRPIKAIYSLRMDPEHARLLKVIKARDGIPESEQIRRALMIWFEQKGVVKPKRKEVERKSGRPRADNTRTPLTR